MKIFLTRIILLVCPISKRAPPHKNLEDLVWFYGMSTNLGNFILNPVYTYILNISI